MRIPCYFKPGNLEAAYVTAIIESPTLHEYGTVEFLVDTGAARTTICDKDVIRMGINYAAIEKLDEAALGVGGAVDTYSLKDATLIFRTADRQGLQEQLERLYILKHEQLNKKLLCIPSILGRDVLNKYELIYDRRNQSVYLTNERVT